MIITGACGVAIAGGIIGIILGPLEKLAVGRIDDNKINSYISRVIDIHNSLIENNKSNQSNATVIGANIILYICIITLPVIFALLGIIIADKVTWNKWIIIPIYKKYNKTLNQVNKSKSMDFGVINAKTITKDLS